MKLLKELDFIFPYLRRYKIRLLLGAGGILLLSLLVLPTSLLTRYIIDKVIPAGNIKYLLEIIAFVFFLHIFTKYLSYANNLLFSKINAHLILEIRMNLLRRVLDMPLQEKEKYTKGYLLSRINNDTAGLNSLFVDTFVHIFKDIITFIVVAVAIFLKM